MKIPSELKHTCGLVGLAIALAGCGQPEKDVHDMPRETKFYDTISLDGMGESELLAHLRRLGEAVTEATSNDQFVEFHHLEIAITATLERLEPLMPKDDPRRRSTATLRSLARQLHEAGHDGNAVLGAKLGPAISDLIARIAATP